MASDEDVQKVEEKDTSGMKWYFVHTHSSYENRARDSIRQHVELAGLTDDLGEIIVPTETVMEVKDGERKERERKLFPGYILVQLRYSIDMWHAVNKAPRVIGFVGGTGKKAPPPVPTADVDRIRGRMEEQEKAPTPVLSFAEGDQVRVIDGPFKNFSGSVEEVNADKAKVRVLVSIFGRATPVELDFVQVEPHTS